MQFTPEQLAELVDSILELMPERITEAITLAYRSERLGEFLNLLRMSELLEPEEEIETYRNGKIVVLGDSDVKECDLLGVAGSLGIGKDRFELCLDYDRVQSYNCRKLQYAPQYRVVLFGAVPHSGQGKGDSSSLITELEDKGKGYPRVIRLNGNRSSLKITKTGFRQALEQLLDEEYIIA